MIPPETTRKRVVTATTKIKGKIAIAALASIKKRLSVMEIKSATLRTGRGSIHNEGLARRDMKQYNDL